MTDTPWEPPLAGTELDHFEGEHASLRRLMCDLIEEYGWRPVSTRQ